MGRFSVLTWFTSVFLILGAYYGVCFIIKLVQGKAIKKAREEANPPDIALDSFRRLPDGSFVRCWDVSFYRNANTFVYIKQNDMM